MITKNNYIAEAKKVEFSKLSKDLQEGHELTNDFVDLYDDLDKETKRIIDSYIASLNKELGKAKKPVAKKKAPAPVRAAVITSKDSMEDVKRKLAASIEATQDKPKASSKKRKVFSGHVPAKDDFGDTIVNEFYDAKTALGPWATMTPKSWMQNRFHGDLGLGKGQRYKKMGDTWFDVTESAEADKKAVAKAQAAVAKEIAKSGSKAMFDLSKYTFYEDGGHGWLAVKRKELDDLGIAHEITGFSYQKGDTVYLEEDQDLSTWAKAIIKKFDLPKDYKFWDHSKAIKTVNHGDHSQIRNYQSYDAPKLDLSKLNKAELEARYEKLKKDREYAFSSNHKDEIDRELEEISKLQGFGLKPAAKKKAGFISDDKEFEKKVAIYLHKKFPRYTDDLLIVDNGNKELSDDEYNDAFFEMVDDLRKYFEEFKGDGEDWANGFVEDYMSNPNNARYYQDGKLVKKIRERAVTKVGSAKPPAKKPSAATAQTALAAMLKKTSNEKGIENWTAKQVLDRARKFQSIRSKRSGRDEKTASRKRLSPNGANLLRWMNAPGSFDLIGIDSYKSDDPTSNLKLKKEVWFAKYGLKYRG